MNRPISRRTFMKAAPAVPLLANDVTKVLTMGNGGGFGAAALAGADISAMGMPIPGGYGILTQPTLYAAYKAGLLPDWAKREIKNHMRYETSGRIPPDIAGLRSVSLSSKFRMSREKAEKAMWDSVDDLYFEEMARQSFWKSKRSLSDQVI